MNFSNNKNIHIFWLLLALSAAGCRKSVEVQAPVSSISGSEVYKTDGTTMAAVTGIYTNLMNGPTMVQGSQSIAMLMGLASDELKNYSTSPAYIAPYTNAFMVTGNYFWGELYEALYPCNAIIQGVTASTSLSDAIHNQALGEAKFMRALLLFYATNLYGDVPLVTTTDYRKNNTISRSKPADVYKQIISDLKDAQSLLSSDYVNGAGATVTDRARPNRAAASALLARVYLYTKDWGNAEALADSIIANTSYQLLTDLSQVFLKASKETIWQMQPVVPGYSTYEPSSYILLAAPGNAVPAAVSSYLLNAFEQNDKRMANWVGSVTVAGSGSIPTTTYYYPYKYKAVPANATTAPAEYLVVLRLAEQYLIRAEARAQQHNLTGAVSDVNIIRSRAGLSDTTASSQTELLAAIAHERQVELFTEWGHRWFDLKRTGAVDSVMGVVTPQKGGVWKTTGQLLPIPANETIINPNLGQNPGYF